jgi:hypothetical protein
VNLGLIDRYHNQVTINANSDGCTSLPIIANN